MKKKFRIGIMALVATMALTTTAVPTISRNKVYASETASIKATATLKTVNVSYDGSAPTEMNVYTVNDEDYVRIQELANHYKIAILPLSHNEFNGCQIRPDKPFSGEVALNALNEKSPTVEVDTGYVGYLNMGMPMKCFVLNDELFVNIVDLTNSFEENLQVKIQVAIMDANGKYKTEPMYEKMDTLIISQKDGVMAINKNTTDLLEIFMANYNYTVKTAPQSEPVKEQARLDTTNSPLHPETLKIGEAMMNGTYQPIVPTFEKQAPLTEPPKVGEHLAKILIDENIGAYNEDGTLNKDNITANYKYNSLTTNFGQCTWYVEGRFTETTGVDARNNEYWTGTGHVGDWLNNVDKNNCPDVIAIRDIDDVRPYSIAIFDGHAVFIDYVEYNASGYPVNIYYTEANANASANGEPSRYEVGKYYPEHNCRVRKVSFETFKKLQWGSLKGYIVAK